MQTFVLLGHFFLIIVFTVFFLLISIDISSAGYILRTFFDGLKKNHFKSSASDIAKLNYHNHSIAGVYNYMQTESPIVCLREKYIHAELHVERGISLNVQLLICDPLHAVSVICFRDHRLSGRARTGRLYVRPFPLFHSAAMLQDKPEATKYGLFHLS